MIKNYITVAVRNLIKNRYFSIINIFGLALSMSVCLILMMLIADQKNNDAYNSSKDRIYRITHNRLFSDELFSEFATAPLPLAPKLLSEYNDLDLAVRIRKGFGNDVIGFEEDLNIPVAGFFVDNEFLSLFELELLHGDPANALLMPNSVVLKEQTAKKLFGDTNPIGNVIKVGDQGEYIVRGVIKNNGEQSHLRFDALASLASLTKLEEQDSVLTSTVNNWKNRYSGCVYIRLKENVSTSTVDEHLAAINKEIYADLEDFNHEFNLQALTAISPGPLLSNEIGPGLPMVFVYFFSGIALLVMISASFNYMNLSIARSLTRAREVGIRKVSGATRKHIVYQFLAEAMILSLISLILSYAMMYFLRPAFSQLHFSQLLSWDLRFDTNVLVFSIVFSLVVGLLAGIIPAYTLSAFQPSQVLKNFSGIKLFSKLGLRKTLIVAQFSLSLVFIISATLVHNQLNYMLGADFGFKTEDILNVRLNNTSYSQFKTELKKYPQISNVTASSHIPAAGMTKSTSLKKNWEDEIELEMPLYDVDEDYIKSLGLNLIAGSNFQRLEPSANEIIVNETTLVDFELGSPEQAIGKYLIDVEDSANLKIVGVLEDYHHQMLIMEMAPVMLIYNPENTSIVHISMLPGALNEGDKIIKSAFETVNPGLKIESEPFTNQLAFYYDLLFGDIAKITSLATVLAMVIACLGLLGMATYTIETKTKEVGIRKVLGASSQQLIIQLSRGFINILLLSILIAVPLAYLLNDLWLQKIAFRVDITIGVIGFGVLILLILGALSIGSQTYRASTINPVDSLRSE